MIYENISEEYYNTLVVSLVSIGLGILGIALRTFWKEFKKTLRRLVEKIDLFIIEIKILYKSKD